MCETIRKIVSRSSLCNIEVISKSNSKSFLFNERENVTILCYVTFQIYSIIGTRLLEACDRSNMSRVEADLGKGRIREQVSKLKDLEVIPTKANKWVSISSQPMIADDKMLERQFQSNQEVSFVDVGDKLKRSSGHRRQQNISIQGKLTSMIMRLFGWVFNCFMNDLPLVSFFKLFSSTRSKA